MTSRRYIKRVWRVPKDRGATTYFAALVTKALVKHGWPAAYETYATGAVGIEHRFDGLDWPSDFQEAVDIALRITARTYRVEVSLEDGLVILHKPYTVTKGGHFREIR